MSKLIQCSVAPDEFAIIDPKVTNADVKAALQAKADNDRAELQAEIVAVLSNAEIMIRQHIEEVRSLRRREAKQKKHLEKINKAHDIAVKDGNFLPLLAVMGRVSPGVEGLSRSDFERLVPEEFRVG